MAKHLHVYALMLFVSCNLCQGQTKTTLPANTSKYQSKGLVSPYGPTTSVRTIIQDRKGNIWLASNEGIIRYDTSTSLSAGGKSFTNVTGTVDSDRFFAVLEDRNGNFWFGNYGAGAYYYNPSTSGESLQHFTTKDGLISNKISSVYEDKAGNIWFGTGGGASRYDPRGAVGKSFRNYIIGQNAIIEDSTGKSYSDSGSGSNGVNPIFEDKTGKIWFGTNGNTYIYDGNKFAAVTDKEGRAFTNVWSIIEDKKGNIWLGGDGLWRYSGGKFTNFSVTPIRYLCEDKAGNIWGSGNVNGRWSLFRFDANSLPDKKPTIIEIPESFNLFGLFAANDGSIWFGSFDGVYRYDGNTITDFKNKAK